VQKDQGDNFACHSLQPDIPKIMIQDVLHNQLELHVYKMKLPYILESNAHPFCSFRGLKNQMRIRFACGLDSRSRAGF
jgi:hypothetical protein